MSRTPSNTLQRIRSTAAETLAEVLIALVVITVGGGAALTLVYTSVSANRLGEERIIAYNLAREGVEAIRNIRDTNWMRFPGDRSNCWDVTLDTTASTSCTTATKIGSATGIDYIVYPDIDDSVSNPSLWHWQLDTVNIATDDLSLYEITVDTYKLYTHDSSGSSTIYDRYVNVVKDSTAQTMTVTSVVSWSSAGGDKSVTFVDELTNY